MPIKDDPSQKYEIYLGNPKLKAENVRVNFTQEQVEEYLKCQADPVYFIENYVKIVHVDRGLVPFEMFEFQKRIVKHINENRFSIAKLSRQCGKTTTIGSYLLWVVLFQKQKSIAILANKGKTAMGILGKIQKSYENLPLWLQQGVREWNKGSLILENGSKIIADSTGGSAGRSESHNIVMLDEFAFVPRSIAEEFITSVYPVITSGNTTKIIMVSTPNGMNLFYKYWTDAVNKKNTYAPITAHWSEYPGRDEKWEQITRANMGDDKFEQEFGGDFMGSSNTLIAATKLNELAWSDPIKKYRTDGGHVLVYDMPKEEGVYVMSVDTSHGQGIDYSAFSVIDVSQMPYKVVATFRSSEISPLHYPDVIFNTAKLYNNAHLLVETNDIGQQIINTLYNDLEYEYIFTTTTQGRGGQKISAGFNKSSKLGVKTTESLKKIGCANLKTIMETDNLIIHDYHTIEEFSTFVRNNKKSYEAEGGNHDDLVMTLVLFAWLAKQDYFKEITDIDIRKKLYSEKIRQINEEMVLMPVMSNNKSTDEFVCNSGDRWVVADDSQRGRRKW